MDICNTPVPAKVNSTLEPTACSSNRCVGTEERRSQSVWRGANMHYVNCVVLFMESIPWNRGAFVLSFWTRHSLCWWCLSQETYFGRSGKEWWKHMGLRLGPGCHAPDCVCPRLLHQGTAAGDALSTSCRSDTEHVVHGDTIICILKYCASSPVLSYPTRRG